MELKDKNQISICKGNHYQNIQITTKSDFFKTKVVYKVSENHIEFRKPTINDNKRIVNPNLDKRTKFYHFFIPIDFEIDFKRYDIEHTDDDEIIYINLAT